LFTLTPPIENAGLYKDLNTLKDLVMSYRQAREERSANDCLNPSRSIHGNLNLSATAGVDH
jgi:cobalamin biosynthesis Mg chelatase CobN